MKEMKKWKKTLAMTLSLSLALSGTMIVGAATSEAAGSNIVIGTQAGVTAASGSAASGEAATAIPVSTTAPSTGSSAATGSAVTGTPAERLKADVDQFNKYLLSLTGEQKVIVQMGELVNSSQQCYIFAQTKLRKKNKNVKTSLIDLNGDETAELLARYPDKKVEIYSHELAMLNDYTDVKPIVTIKKVDEFRIPQKGSGKFIVKQKTGKKITYTKYKYTWPRVKKKVKYTVNGKSYYKGKKSISEAEFNKFMKTYKKWTPAAWQKLQPGVYPMYDPTDYLYATPDMQVLTTRMENSSPSEYLPTRRIFKHDASDKENPYKAFGEDVSDYRYVFGWDAEADWTALRKKEIKLQNVCAQMKEIYKGKDIRVDLHGTDEKTGYTIYNAVYDYGDGTDGDMFYRIVVDETGPIPLFRSVTENMSVGVDYQRYDFIYDTAYDGEYYTPGLDVECYGAPDFSPGAGFRERTLTVDYAGTKTKVKTTTHACYKLYTSTGKFYATVDGKEVDIAALKEDSHEHYLVNQLMNPDSGDVGYEDPTGEIVWRAS